MLGPRRRGPRGLHKLHPGSLALSPFARREAPIRPLGKPAIGALTNEQAFRLHAMYCRVWGDAHPFVQLWRRFAASDTASSVHGVSRAADGSLQYGVGTAGFATFRRAVLGFASWAQQQGQLTTGQRRWCRTFDIRFARHDAGVEVGGVRLAKGSWCLAHPRSFAPGERDTMWFGLVQEVVSHAGRQLGRDGKGAQERC